MEENRKHIDDVYQEKLGNHTELPDAAVWESLNSRLDAHYAQPHVPKSVPTHTHWVWKAVVALLAGAALYYAVKYISNKNTGTKAKTATSVLNSNDDGIVASNNINYPATKEVPVPESNSDTDTPSVSNEVSTTTIAPSVATTTSARTTTPVVTNTTTVKTTTPSVANNTSAVTAASANNNTAAVTTPATSATNKKNTPITDHKPAIKAKDEISQTNAAPISPVAQYKKTNTGTVSNSIKGNKETQPSKQRKHTEVVAANNTAVTDATTTAKGSMQDAVSNTSGSISTTTSAATTVHEKRKGRASGSAMATPRIPVASGRTTTAKKTSNKKSTQTASKATGSVGEELSAMDATSKTSGNSGQSNATTSGAAKSKTAIPAEEQPIVPQAKPVAKTAAEISTDNPTESKPTEATVIKPKDSVVAMTNTATTTPAPADEKVRKRQKIEFGVKVGYDMAFKTYHANSVTVSPYLKARLWDKLAIVVQPTLKYAMVNKTDLDPAKSYYRVTSSKLDSTHTTVPGDTMSPATITRRYYYSQSHDSISIGISIQQKSYMEFELPVLLQYPLFKGLSLYGGLSLNYSNVVRMGEERQEFTNIKRSDSLLFGSVPVTQPAPTVPSVESRFSYNTTPYSQYNSSTTVQNPNNTPARFSYMLGFNYEFKNRLMVDVLFQLQGLLSNPVYIPDTRIREIYKQPHVRLSVGYRFGKIK